ATSFSLIGDVTDRLVTAGLKFLVRKYSPLVPASADSRTRYAPVASGWYWTNSLRPSARGVPDATCTPVRANRAIRGLRVLTNWLGPSAGVAVSSRRALAALVTLTVYQSSWAAPVVTKSKRVTRPLWNDEPLVSLTVLLLKIRLVTPGLLPTAS